MNITPVRRDPRLCGWIRICKRLGGYPLNPELRDTVFETALSGAGKF